jgi:hypothetical protein
MRAFYPDTHPAMEALQIGLLRKANPTRKMELLAQLNASARRLVLAGLSQRHPRANQAQLRFMLAELLLGGRLAMRVYGVTPNAK